MVGTLLSGLAAATSVEGSQRRVHGCKGEKNPAVVKATGNRIGVPVRKKRTWRREASIPQRLTMEYTRLM